MGGSSAGAIGAMLLAVGNNAAAIGNKLTEMDFTSFLDAREPEKKYKEKLLNLSVLSIGQSARKKRLKGLFKGDAFVNWAKNEIRQGLERAPDFQTWLDQYRQNGKKNDLAGVTYNELHEYIEQHPDCPFKDLFVTATNITKDEGTVLSYETTPHEPIWLGVRMSMSFPGVFEAVEYDLFKEGKKDLFVDGGLADNYPVKIFDAIQFVPAGYEGFYRRTGHNLGTVGIKIDNIQECARILWNMNSYADLNDLTVRAHEHNTLIQIKDREPPREKIHRNELCIYDISYVDDPNTSQEEQKSKPPQILKLKYIIKHDVTDKEGKKKEVITRGEILEGNDEDQLPKAYIMFLYKNIEKLDDKFKSDTYDNEFIKRALEKLLKITTARRHTPQKKIASVSSAGNLGEQAAMYGLYGKTINSQQSAVDVEKMVNRFYSHQTIQIYDTGVDTLQFGINEKEKKAMYDSGYNTTSQFLDNYMYENLPEDISANSIQSRTAGKTLEELFELLEEYNSFILGVSESTSETSYPLEIYHRDKEYIEKLISYRLLDDLPSNKQTHLSKTSIFSTTPDKMSPQRMRMVEGVLQSMQYFSEVENKKMGREEDEFVDLIDNNRALLSKYGEVPARGRILAHHVSEWIFNPVDLKRDQPDLYKKITGFVEQRIKRRDHLKALIEVEKKLLTTVASIHAHQEHRAEFKKMFKTTRTEPTNPKKETPEEEVKIHVPKISKG